MKNLCNLYLDYRRSHKRYVLRVLFTLIMVLSCLFLFVIFNEQLASSLIITNPTLLHFVKLPTVQDVVGSVANLFGVIARYVYIGYGNYITNKDLLVHIPGLNWDIYRNWTHEERITFVLQGLEESKRTDLEHILNPQQVLNYLDSVNVSKKIDMINGTKEYISMHYVLPVVEPTVVVQSDPYSNNMQAWGDIVNMVGNGVKNGCVFLVEHPIIPLTIVGLLCISSGYYYVFHYQPWHLEQTQNLAENIEAGDVATVNLASNTADIASTIKDIGENVLNIQQISGTSIDSLAGNVNNLCNFNDDLVPILEDQSVIVSKINTQVIRILGQLAQLSTQMIDVQTQIDDVKVTNNNSIVYLAGCLKNINGDIYVLKRDDMFIKDQLLQMYKKITQ